jgi:AraC-like DNA-binding protein
MSVEWIYEQCGIIEREFAARFKLYFGHYPKSYYVHHRIEVSKLMLTQTEALVTEVALMVGFDTSNFCKAFKRKVGMTPTEWREWR